MREYRAGGPEGADALARAVPAVLADAPSPWRIEPPYAADDRTVLERLLSTIESAVGETGYDPSAWTERRRRATAAERLVYEAANRDLLVRLPDAAD
ncbi:hypothetical protein [Halorubrum sp. CBA1125]|uniref:hypothetical protein n=1 Tax=Halorubrum sp. CBA1125 TaxID=2668072 RepID=UPI001E432489|nr:hypothetical protein [Halorubrum sp. CBA1125]